MKKFFVVLLALLCFSVIPVEALEEDTNVNVLYPVSSSFNVVTEYFNYENLVYNPNLDVNGNTTISIGKVHNSASKKVPVSIRVGLFDSEQKNIGVVNYCSTRDTESDYSYKMLLADQEIAFYVKVSEKKNIAKGKKLEDVAYIAVLDDNNDCSRDGMENKYVGLTIDEIVDGQVSSKVEKLLKLDFLEKLQNLDLSKVNTGAIIFIAIVLIIYIVQASILNALNKRMFDKTTILAYIPIANMYLAVKLVFGPFISKIYIISYLVTWIVGGFVPIVSLLASLISLIGGICFIIVIVKLVTKKYDMLYFQNMKDMKKRLSGGINNAIEMNRVVNNDMYDVDNEELLDNLKKSTNPDATLKQSTSDDLLASLGVDIHGNTSSIEEEKDEKDDSGGRFFNISPDDSKSDENFTLGSGSKSDDDDEDSSSLEDFFK